VAEPRLLTKLGSVAAGRRVFISLRGIRQREGLFIDASFALKVADPLRSDIYTPVAVANSLPRHHASGAIVVGRPPNSDPADIESHARQWVPTADALPRKSCNIAIRKSH
jgi:hypothetical protein